MPYYETVFIARPDLTDGQVQELTETMSKIITDQGGKILKTENWGLRKLAYTMNKSRKGHYVLLESDTPSAAVIEMGRQMRLSEDVMRELTIRLDAPSEGPSVMMEKPKSDHLDDNKNQYNKDNKDKKEAA